MFGSKIKTYSRFLSCVFRTFCKKCLRQDGGIPEIFGFSLSYFKYIEYSIRFASPGGPEKLLWSPGTLDEFRKWHAQMCLRLGPQGRENSVAFDVHCIILEVFFVVMTPFWCCFVASEAPGCMKKLF